MNDDENPAPGRVLESRVRAGQAGQHKDTSGLRQSGRRVPPHDPAIEAALLGAMLLAPRAVDAALNACDAGDFYIPRHADIFDAIVHLHQPGEPLAVPLVAGELERRGRPGAIAELTELTADAPDSSTARRLAGEIRHHAQRRRTLALNHEIAEAIYQGADPAGLVARIGAEVTAAQADTDRAVPGDEFVLDISPTPPAIWGKDERVLMAEGESTLIVGPTGAGKTSVTQQIVKARIGLQCEVLGFPVREANRVLYIAADRPAQAARSMARMVTERDREVLRERLIFYKGAPPFDIGADPHLLLPFARKYGADFVVVDSLKDVAMDLRKDDVGSRVNAALQNCLANDVDLLVLHHQRKEQTGGGKPKKISDVYGSNWITAGAGSVILLWGEPGDPVVELIHLKQPSEPVGPLTVIHDHHAGVSRVEAGRDAWTIVQASHRGITASGLATVLYGNAKPTPAEIEKARRSLEGLVRKGQAHRQPGQKGGAAGGTPALYFAIAPEPDTP